MSVLVHSRFLERTRADLNTYRSLTSARAAASAATGPVLPGCRSGRRLGEAAHRNGLLYRGLQSAALILYDDIADKSELRRG